jgi:hypothetical protein
MGFPPNIRAIAWGFVFILILLLILLLLFVYIILLIIIITFRIMYFRFGLERPVMIKYGLSNIRDLVGHKLDLNFVRTNPVCRLDKE